MVTWTAIDCVNRNGEITGYEVVFQRVDGTATTDGQVVGQTFIASRLQSFTDYTFQVRGVNSAGMGPFTTAITIHTDEGVPGVVYNFIVDLQFISVTFNWSAPVKPNGIIIAYELTYRVNNTNPISVNITGFGNTMDFDVSTLISGISIRAYTSVGPGSVAITSDVMILTNPEIPVVRNVHVVQALESETSVTVSWNRSTSTSVTGYTVYYSPESGRRSQANEMSVTVPSTENVVRIDGLESGVTYQFQVTITISFRGTTREGERSEVSDLTRTLPVLPEKCADVNVAISISTIVTFLLTIILYTFLLVLGYCLLRSRYLKASKDTTSGIVLKENEAYGPLTASQEPHDDVVYAEPDVNRSGYYNIAKI